MICITQPSIDTVPLKYILYFVKNIKVQMTTLEPISLLKDLILLTAALEQSQQFYFNLDVAIKECQLSTQTVSTFTIIRSIQMTKH